MRARNQTSLWISLISLIVLGACGGGGSSSPTIAPPLPPPPATETISAVGVITGLSSVTMNGVLYATPATVVSVNGQPGSLADLKLGQIAALEGTIEVDGPRGTAAQVDYQATVIGPVESIDAGLGQLLVMGQTVLTDADTVFDSSIDPSTFAGLGVGSNAQISGFRNANGDVVATRIDPDPVSTNVQIIGSVEGLNPGNMLFAMNRLNVDYSSAASIDLPNGMPADGMFLIARGTLTNGILVVSEIESLYEAGGTPGERANSQGSITRFMSPTDFHLNGLPVITDANTVFTGGTSADLQANARITIDGEIAAGGGSILANTITFGAVVDPTTTLTFTFSNFTEISVVSVFNATVTQGSDFSVEVTIDSDVASRVDVTQTGSRLSIGLLPGSGNIATLEAVVTLPVLNSIDLEGVVNVTLQDFNQTALTANVSGVSRLRGEALMIGALTADVAGVSQLDFGDIRPLGSATIDVNGVSLATLNMDVGSTLTGSVGTGQGSGVSSLRYYGTNVTVNVTTDFLSTVTRLGDTRP